jgi:hypothetical protein
MNAEIRVAQLDQKHQTGVQRSVWENHELHAQKVNSQSEIVQHLDAFTMTTKVHTLSEQLTELEQDLSQDRSLAENYRQAAQEFDDISAMHLPSIDHMITLLESIKSQVNTYVDLVAPQSLMSKIRKFFSREATIQSKIQKQAPHINTAAFTQIDPCAAQTQIQKMLEALCYVKQRTLYSQENYRMPVNYNELQSVATAKAMKFIQANCHTQDLPGYQALNEQYQNWKNIINGKETQIQRMIMQKTHAELTNRAQKGMNNPQAANLAISIIHQANMKNHRSQPNT